MLDCSSSVRIKGIAIFRVSTENDEWSNNSWKNIINIVT